MYFISIVKIHKDVLNNYVKYTKMYKLKYIDLEYIKLYYYRKNA
nr:MAG TPA: hypothetical protein [Caudoviricetes sp.]